MRLFSFKYEIKGSVRTITFDESFDNQKPTKNELAKIERFILDIEILYLTPEKELELLMYFIFSEIHGVVQCYECNYCF